MKSFLSLMLLICLAFVSMAQVASDPPVADPASSHITKAVMDNDFEPGLYVIYSEQAEGKGTVACVLGKHPDLSVSGSPITSSGTITLAIPSARLTPLNDARLTPERSKQIENPNLPYVYDYPWNPGYVGWQR